MKAPRAVPKRSGARANKDDRTVLLQVARELMDETVATLLESGLSRKEQQRVFKLAITGKRVRHRPAKLAMQRSLAFAEMLTHWQRDKRYTDAHGAPKVLPVLGRGTTLANLAKQFVPDMAVGEVVTAIVRQGEVIRMKGERVALLGTSLIVPPKTTELTLAHITLGIQRLKSAILQNVSLLPNQKNRGSLQRFVSGKLPQEAFAEWSVEVRAELQQLIFRLDSGLKAKAKRTDIAKDSGVGIFIFRDE